MFSCLQQPFLQALGYAITNSVWQMFLLWMIVQLVSYIARQSSDIKYVTAVSAQVAGFVWFLSTCQFYYRHCYAASVQAQQFAGGSVAVNFQNVVSGSHGVLSFLVRMEEVLPYLSVAYLVLLLYSLLKWIQNYRFAKVLSTTGLEMIDNRWQVFVNEMADKLSIMQSVKIHLSSIAESPLTIGYLKPVILLPVASLNHLTTEQAEAVILHELAHIKRADYIINLLLSVAEMIMFFNPFTRLISRTIQKERENCCDDRVLQNQYSAGMYAEALLRIACLQREGFQMNAAAQQKGELLQRVKRMVKPGQKKFGYRHQATAMMFIAALLFCIAWLQPDENDYQKSTANYPHTEDKKVAITPIIAQIDNPFFNGASLLNSSLHDDMMESLAEWDKANLDSVVAKSSQQALRELDKVAPAVMTTMSPGDWRRVVKEATESAAQSLKNLKTQNPALISQQFTDSAFLLQTINAALSGTKHLGALQEGLNAAKKEIEKMQHDKALNNGFSFSTDYLNQLSINTLASLQNFHFDFAQDFIDETFNKIKQTTDKQIRKAQEQAEKQSRLLNQMQANRNRIIASADSRRLPPSPPSVAEAPQDIDEPQDTTDLYDAADEPPPAAYNWSFTEPVVQYDNQNQNKVSKTIHITRNRSGKGTLNIVIEIRQ